MATILLSFILGLSITYGQGSNTLNLELLAKGLKGSQCLDGTQAGFYYEAPISSSGDSTWTIYLQGGGHCCTKSGCDSRANGPLGSSKYWHPTMKGTSVYSTSSTENPGIQISTVYTHKIYILYIHRFLQCTSCIYTILLR